MTATSYRPTIVGHRGAAGLAPENTVPSFRRAVELGVEWVELDVRLTADGVPVCLHDESLDRTTDGSGPIGGVTLEQLRALTVQSGALAAAEVPVRVPTLAEALAAIPPPVGVLVELKRDDAREADLVRATVTAIAVAGMAERVRLISFQESLLAEARRQAPQLPRGCISGRDLERLFTVAARLECVSIHPNAALLTDGIADRCAAAGLLLNTWTVNDEPAIRRAAEQRADEITTDLPDVAHAVLAAMGVR